MERIRTRSLAGVDYKTLRLFDIPDDRREWVRGNGLRLVRGVGDIPYGCIAHSSQILTVFSAFHHRLSTRPVGRPVDQLYHLLKLPVSLLAFSLP